MDLGLAGKKAIVTGGTRGIGRAIVEELVNEGCHIGICARDGEAVASAVEALRARGVSATGRSVDVGNGDSLKHWISDVGDELGGLDIVVANASGFGTTPDDAGWQISFEVDVMGTIHTVEAAMPLLEASEAASIVAISSGAAYESFPHIFPPGRLLPYGAMKTALTHYISSLSQTGAPKGIRANTVTPGSIYFPGGGWERNQNSNPEVYNKMLAQCPMGRLGRPDEVAKGVVFLASPAASYITGANLVIDGAQSRRIQY